MGISPKRKRESLPTIQAFRCENVSFREGKLCPSGPPLWRTLFADKNEVSWQVSNLCEKAYGLPKYQYTSIIESLHWMFLRSFSKESFQVFKPQTICSNLVITGTERSIISRRNMLSCYELVGYSWWVLSLTGHRVWEEFSPVTIPYITIILSPQKIDEQCSKLYRDYKKPL